MIAAATSLIFVAVLHRYGAGLSIDIAKWADARNLAFIAVPARAAFTWLAALDLSWAQELCIYMFIWMAKFGAAYGVRTGIHVGVDVLVNILPGGSRRRVITIRPAVRRALHRHRGLFRQPPSSARCGRAASSPTISKRRCGWSISPSRSAPA